jgi:hypothetical protein
LQPDGSNRYFTTSRLDETQQQADDRTFACAGGTDECDVLPRRDSE